MDFFLYHLLIFSLNSSYILWVFSIQWTLNSCIEIDVYVHKYSCSGENLQEIEVFTFHSIELRYMYLRVCCSFYQYCPWDILSMLRSQDVVQLVNCPCISLILNFTRSSCYLIMWKSSWSWSEKEKKITTKTIVCTDS